MKKKIIILSLSILLIAGMIALFLAKPKDVTITDIQMTTELDENLQPVKPTNIFPKGTSKIFAWVEWQKSKVNTEVVAKWYYVTDDIRILEYPFAIPKKNGSGGVSLTMPEGKKFPVGEYRIDITLRNRKLKSQTFKVK